MITFFEQLMLSSYFSCGFFGTNQLVSVFVLYIMVNENVACSSLLGYSAISTIICSINKVLITFS